MKFIEKRLFLKSGLIFCLIQALLYVPVHLINTGVLNGLGDTALVFIGSLSAALSEFAAFLLPIIAATVLFVSYTYRGFWHAVPRVLVFSLPYLIGSVPENYVTYLAAFDSLGALFFAVIISLLVTLAVTAQILALFGVICYFFRFPKEARFEERSLLPLEDPNAFDFSGPFAKGLFAATLLQFLITVAREGYNTYNYFSSIKGTYRLEELFTIIFTFLFIILELVVSYVLAYKLKNKLITERLAHISNKKTEGKAK